MNYFVGTSPWRSITTDIARKRRDPIVAAIGYVGSNAMSVLPLRDGDFLICDASERAIRQGVTSAEVLGGFKRNRVRVFSVEGLHSKVVTSKKFSWVGSANASSNSRDNLIEASVRIEGTECQNALKWALSLATDDAELTIDDIQVLKRIPISWEARGGLPSKSKPLLTMPKKLSALKILEFNKNASAKAIKSADLEKSDVRKTLKTNGTQLLWFQQDSKGHKSKDVKIGDWFIDIEFGRLGRPCQVLKISKKLNYDIVWYERIKTSRRHSVRELQNCISGLEKGFSFKRITDSGQIRSIRKIYGV
jgi:hypothetical protein